MEDDPERVPRARPDAADAVPQADAEIASRAAHGPLAHSEDHPFALSERLDLGPRLHARALLDDDQFAAREIDPRPAQQKRDLKGEYRGAIESAVQAVVVGCRDLNRVAEVGRLELG